MPPHVDDEIPPMMTGLFKYGVPAAIAVYLVYFLTQGIGGELRSQTELLQQHVASTVAIQRTIETDERWHATMTDVMRQLCINSAKSYPERAACFQAGVK